uniref:Hypothetical_protein n=1 Tax=Oryza brachyantha TaxID=4533 RepID=G2XME8_ORYBR|nr:hypothetical_protein [Oryza brachyantha]
MATGDGAPPVTASLVVAPRPHCHRSNAAPRPLSPGRMQRRRGCERRAASRDVRRWSGRKARELDTATRRRWRSSVASGGARGGGCRGEPLEWMRERRGAPEGLSGDRWETASRRMGKDEASGIDDKGKSNRKQSLATKNSQQANLGDAHSFPPFPPNPPNSIAISSTKN